MKEAWNERLKKCRENKGFTLKELEEKDKLGISQQSLIKYEKGDVYPRIDLLKRMCELYGVSVDYILYGDERMNIDEDKKSSLLVLYLMMYSEKLVFDEEKQAILINDETLLKQIEILDALKKRVDLNSIDKLLLVAEGLKKITEIM